MTQLPEQWLLGVLLDMVIGVQVDRAADSADTDRQSALEVVCDRLRDAPSFFTPQIVGEDGQLYSDLRGLFLLLLKPLVVLVGQITELTGESPDDVVGRLREAVDLVTEL